MFLVHHSSRGYGLTRRIPYVTATNTNTEMAIGADTGAGTGVGTEVGTGTMAAIETEHRITLPHGENPAVVMA